MKTALKIIGGLLGIVVLLVVAAPLLVSLFVDPNDLKSRVETLVEENTGRQLEIAGDLGVSVFPWLGVELGAARLGNAAGFAPDTFAQLDSAQVRVKLLPLLSKQVEMDTVTVEGLRVHLARDAGGRFNWDDLASAGGGAPASDGPPPVAALAIGGVHLKGASVTWQDAVTGARYEASELELRTGALSPGSPIDLSFVGRVAANQPALAAIVNGKAQLSADLGAKRYSARELGVTADLTGPVLPGGRLRIGVGGDASFDQPNGQISVSGLELKVSELTVDGTGAVLTLTAQVNANLASELYTAQGLRLTADLSGPGIPGGAAQVVLGGDAGLSLPTGRFALSSLTVESSGVKAGGEVVITNLLKSPRVAGNLAVEPFSPREVLAKLGAAVPATADRAVLARAELSTQISGSPAKVSLSPLVVTLDDTTLRGDVSATTAKVPAVRFDLAMTGLDLDRYLPPKTSAKATPATAAAAGGGLPLDLLRSLDIAGGFKADRLKASGVALDKLSAKVYIADGVLKVRPITARVAGGSYAGGVLLDARARVPSITVDEQLKDVSVGTLLEALGIADPGIGLAGARGDIRLTGQASGDPSGQRFRFAKTALKADLEGRSLPGGRLRASVGGDVDLDLGANQVQVDDLKLDALGVRASGNVKASGLGGAPRFEGQIASAPFNARKLLESLGQKAPDTADPKALTAVSVDTRFDGTGNSLRLAPLSLRVDGTRLEGNVDVTDLARQAVRFDLSVDSLDLDRYLPPASAAPAAATPGAAAGAAGGVPVETLRALDADGQLRVGTLTMSNLNLKDIRLTLKAKDGMIRLNPATAQLYQGSYSGNVSLDATGKQPMISLDEQLTDVQAGPLLKDFNGSDRITGRADAAMRLTAVGTDAATARRTLNGTVDFRFRDGTIKGVDMVHWICQAAQAQDSRDLKSAAIGALLGEVTRSARGGDASGDDTRFSEARGSLDIRDGVARNRDLDVRSPLVRVSGDGVVDLVAEQVDYTARPALVSSCRGQGGATGTDVSGTTVPVRISGSFAKLSYDPDYGALLGLLKRRPRPAEPAPAQATAPPPSAPPEPAAPQEPKDVIKEVGKGLLKGIFGRY